MKKGVVSYDKMKLKLKFKGVEISDDFIDLFNPDMLSEVSGFEKFFGNPANIFTLKDFKLTRVNDIKEYYRCKNYKNVFNVLFENDVIGFLSWNPYNPLLSQDLICFDLVNSFLYYTHWRTIVKDFFYEFDLIVKHPEILEISYDTNVNILKKVRYLIKHLNDKYNKNNHNGKKLLIQNGEIVDVGKDYSLKVGDGLFTIRMVKIPGNKIKQFFEGYKIYNKTDEIKISQKNYILTYLHSKKIDINKDVYRLEFSINRKSLVNRGIKFDKSYILNENKINDLFDMYFDYHFDYRMVGNEKRFSRMKRVKNILD